MHDKASAPRLGAHDRGILLRKRFLCHDKLHTVVKKKKKKKKKRTPGILGHNMVLEPRFINTLN